MDTSLIGILFVIGRILYGGYFFMASVNHFVKNEMLAGYAASKGVPSSRIAVYGSGVLLFFGGLGILTGIFIEISVVLLVVFLLVVSFKMHAYWTVLDPTMRAAEMQAFLKNMALLGAALMFLEIQPAGIWSLLPY